MDFLEFFKLLFLISFGILVALVLAFYIIWPKVEVLLFKLKGVNQHCETARDANQLKFTAYERLLLFVHRITPYQVMLRNHNDNLTIKQYKQAVINDIENEYHHNFTQQLYVSDVAWSSVKGLKDDTITLFKNTAKTLPAEGKVEDYINLILKHVANLETNPYVAAQVILKKELSA